MEILSEGLGELVDDTIPEAREWVLKNKSRELKEKSCPPRRR